MKLSKTLFGLVVAYAASVAQGLIPITIKGDRFIRPAANATQDGEVFTVIGLDYQPGGASNYDPNSGSDVLTDQDACLRDAFVMQQLGINTVRIYTVNPWLNHDACMSIFNAVGIYVVLDVNSALGGESLSRSDPGSSYTEGYLNRVFGVIDAFKGYPNVLGFFAGNEVVNDDSSAKIVPPYIRAVQRDMKQYISKHANRTIPVGYSAADDNILREAMWSYLQCGDEESRSDFYGLNSYDWCSGRDDWQTSGYGQLLSTFDNTSIPLFLSEFGCNVVSPRTFDEVYDGVYAGLMQAFSGGLIYEYSQESNTYGLVEIQDDGSVNLLQDFDNLQKAYNTISLNQTSEASTANISSPQCDAKAISALDSSFDANWTLPDSPGSDMIENGGGNQNIGKIIALNSTQTTYKIYNVKGEQISNTSITVNPDNQVNSPSGQNTTDQPTESGSSESSSESPSPTTSTSSGIAAGGYEIPTTGFVGAIIAFLALII